MKRKLLLLNIAIIIPCFFVYIGILPFTYVFILAFMVSLVNVRFATSKRNLITYNLILFVCSTIGIILEYLARKNYGVGFHPGVTEEYQFLMGFFVLCSLIITILEIVLEYFLHKRK